MNKYGCIVVNFAKLADDIRKNNNPVDAKKTEDRINSLRKEKDIDKRKALKKKITDTARRESRNPYHAAKRYTNAVNIHSSTGMKRERGRMDDFYKERNESVVERRNSKEVKKDTPKNTVIADDAFNYEYDVKPKSKSNSVKNTKYIKPGIAAGAGVLVGSGLYLANRAKKKKEKEANYSYMSNFIQF